MNYRNLSDRELVTLAEAVREIMNNQLFAELVYRVARGCGHAMAVETGLYSKTNPRGERTGLLFNSGVLQD